MTAEQKIDQIIYDYYQVHHNTNRFRSELIEAVSSSKARVEGFMECKRRVTSALDHRIADCAAALKVLTSLKSVHAEVDARKDEMESFRSYVKGMVVKAAGETNEQGSCQD